MFWNSNYISIGVLVGSLNESDIAFSLLNVTLMNPPIRNCYPSSNSLYSSNFSSSKEMPLYKVTHYFKASESLSLGFSYSVQATILLKVYE